MISDERKGNKDVEKEAEHRAGIAGYAICQVAGISRAKLSDIERGHVMASPEELARIDGAIEQILRTRQDILTLASKAGLCLTGVRL